jgi:DNA-binding PadR family transcriptional regulator
MRKRRKTESDELAVMEYFILALIGKARLRSLYAFRQTAEVEPGAIRGALKHLEERRLITRAEPASRKRRDMALTQAGWSLLQESWTRCLSEHADAESVLRAAWIAMVMSEPEHAATYLEEIGKMRQIEAQETTTLAEYLERRNATGPPSDYVWMRTSSEAYRRSAESAAFLSISRSLRERSRKDVRPLSASTNS